MMNFSTLILAVAMLLRSIAPTLESNINQSDPGGVSIVDELPCSTTLNTKNIHLAENKKSSPSNNEKSHPASANKTVKSDSDSITGRNEPSTKSKSKPLKPFVPSEKIAAEQAVDFPVDI